MIEQVRHRPPAELTRPRELVVACAPFRSNVNLSTVVRTAGCCAVQKLVICGNNKIDPKVARDAAEHLVIEKRNSLVPVLKTLRADGYRLVGLEQTTNSVDLHTYRFERRTALVIGNERLGLSDEEIALTDDCVEIPVWGMPHSYNVSSATAMAMYEYCKQFPAG